MGEGATTTLALAAGCLRICASLSTLRMETRAKANGRAEGPAIASLYGRLTPLVQRLDAHDRGAVVAADPEHGPSPGLLDEDAAGVGGGGAQVVRARVGP